MKRKIGIVLILILQLAFLCFTTYIAYFSYAIFVAAIGIDRGLMVANEILVDNLLFVLPTSIVVIVCNYLIIKKLIANSAPWKSSLLFTLACLVIFSPFLISARHSFIKYQIETTRLYHYLEENSIVKIEIVTAGITINVSDVSGLIQDLLSAKYIQGPRKYAKKEVIIITRKSGKTENIITNGQLFYYRNKYFIADSNVVDKYIGY